MGQPQISYVVNLLDADQLSVLSPRKSPTELHVPGLALLFRRPFNCRMGVRCLTVQLLSGRSSGSPCAEGAANAVIVAGEHQGAVELIYCRLGTTEPEFEGAPQMRNPSPDGVIST